MSRPLSLIFVLPFLTCLSTTVFTFFLDICKVYLSQYTHEQVLTYLKITDQKDFRLREPDVQGFVDACLARIEPLLANENRRIVLVIDGDAHPVKKKTHKKRELEAMKAFNQARHQYISSHGNIQDNPIFLAKAKKWLRFTPEIKDETILVRYIILYQYTFTNVRI